MIYYFTTASKFRPLVCPFVGATLKQACTSSKRLNIS